MIDAWDRISLSLENRLTPGHFQLWIKPLQGCLENDTLVLQATNEFVCTWVRERMLDRIKDAAAETLGFAPAIALGSAQAGAVTVAQIQQAPPKKWNTSTQKMMKAHRSQRMHRQPHKVNPKSNSRN